MARKSKRAKSSIQKSEEAVSAGAAVSQPAAPAPMPKPPPILPTPGPLPDLNGQVVLRLLTDGVSEEIRFTPTPKMREAAMEWIYILRNRRRWTNNDDIKKQQQADLTALLLQQGLQPDSLAQLAKADLVEVCIPHLGQSSGWELRIFPWEHVLNAVTRDLRGTHRFTVIRQLHVTGRIATPQGEPRRILMVETAPCGIRESFSFDSERRLVQESFKGAQFVHELLVDPTRELLLQKVQAFGPDVIHVAGVDTHQAFQLLPSKLQELMLQRFTTSATPSTDRKQRVRDGLLLRDAQNEP